MKNRPFNNTCTLKSTSVFCFLTFLSSCDIPGRLVVVNKTDTEVVVRFKSTFQSMSGLIGPELLVSNRKRHRTETILFGFGHIWTDEAIADFASTLEFLEIEANGKKTVLSDENKIRDFLTARRRGLMKREIRIKIKE